MRHDKPMKWLIKILIGNIEYHMFHQKIVDRNVLDAMVSQSVLSTENDWLHMLHTKMISDMLNENVGCKCYKIETVIGAMNC